MALYSIETYGELEPHLSQEWLLTNGVGGFACGSVVGCNRRRYHGLLIAAQSPPVDRVMLLNRIGETIIAHDQPDRPLEFSVNQFGDLLQPRGDRYLRRFDHDQSLVRWDYDVEGIHIVKELQIVSKRNIVGIRYAIDPNGRSVELRLMPFARLMDFHALRHGPVDLQHGQDGRNCWVQDGHTALHISADVGEFVPGADWWHNYTYAIETERGLDDTEDLFTPGTYVVSTSEPMTVTLWAGQELAANLDWDEELDRRATSTKPLSPIVNRLTHAAGDFVVFRKSPDGKDGSTVIAGYPWFADWGRDTMISLPGLLLVTGQFEQARQVLCVFAQFVSEGMIPNRFDDYTNEPHYNTVDASLWFIHAAFEYARTSGDKETLEKLLKPACRQIIDGYTHGTRYNIHVDPADGLVIQGDAHTQLTWMDAKCDGVAFTPRQGKAVEINALWYHALVLMGDKAAAAKVADSFRKLFWISPYRGLADVVDGSRKDASIRPNQIFAASLENSPLTRDQQHAVVETVRRELLTPVGLRTLARSDPNYHGTYRGSQQKRDEAYHNGTVWAWPLGAFLEAYLRVNDQSAESKEQARRWLLPLLQDMRRDCIGQIAEIFEGDEPHRPVGCVAQAWSVAEALRLAVMLEM